MSELLRTHRACKYKVPGLFVSLPLLLTFNQKPRHLVVRTSPDYSVHPMELDPENSELDSSAL